MLISSQAHAGLDNALSELHRRDDTVRLLRLGRADDERVSPDVAERLAEEIDETPPDPPLPTDAWQASKPIIEPILSVLDLERLSTTYLAIERMNRFGLDPLGTGASWHVYDLAPPVGPGAGRVMPRLDLTAMRETVDVGLRSIVT